ncbi:MAG: FG-GAP-like repeat-containing protein [Spirochaetota bacterium]|nr:FG-GAP-like repeat-containing protein [Spirochaetota bacterium]
MQISYKILLASILIISLIAISTCYLDLERDNSNDPDGVNYKPPVIEASFTSSVINGYVPLTVNFTDVSTGNIETREWDFDNDGIVDSTDTNPSFVFKYSGKYPVKLKVTARKGLIVDEKTQIIDVSFGPPEKYVITSNEDGPYIISAADIDNDGDIDLICTYNRLNYNNKLSWWENIDGSAVDWQEHIIDDEFIISICLSDVDDDGDVDILGASYTTGEVLWWENDGTPRDDEGGDGNSWTEHIIKSGFDRTSSVYASDIDNDGDIDVVATEYGHYDDTEEEWVNGGICWWENDGSPEDDEGGDGNSWTEHIIINDLSTSCSAFTSDVDGDEDIDIIVSTYGYYDNTNKWVNSGMYWWENDGTPRDDIGGDGNSWTKHSIIMEGDADNSAGPRATWVADIDGDGDMDITGAFWESDEILLFENTDGQGINWTKHYIDRDFFGAQSVYATDIDSDGDVDILGASRLGDEIIWWENIDGTCMVWTAHTVDAQFIFASSAISIDINADGYMDIVGAANGYYYTNLESSITWWSIFVTSD